MQEKIHIAELERSRQEQGSLEERLEAASLRYMLAEKKLDRVKSTTVQKLEKQAIASGKSETTVGIDNNVDGEDMKVDTDALYEAEKAKKVADALFAKQKEQLLALETENEKLMAQITTLETRLTHLSDDDYSKTDLFKHLKSQHEDVIKRINDLETTNVKLREEAEKYQAERMAYRSQIEQESQMAIQEKEALLAQAEFDLARIRTVRDELQADVQMRKAAQSQERASIEQIKELAIAREERIKVLESQIERLNMQPPQTNGVPSPQPSVEDNSTDDLHTKYTTLEKQYAMLKAELQSMEKVYQKTSLVASQKVTNLTNLEEKTIRLSAEKSKADQKYFATMKLKESREQEVRTLRAQNSKTSEIVSQLKDSEAANRNLVINLEKQVAEQKSAIATLGSKHSASQQQVNERTILNEGLRLQVEELKKILSTKDSSSNLISSAHRKAESEIEALKVQLAETQKSLESWKTKGLGNQNEEYEMLRVRVSILIFALKYSSPNRRDANIPSRQSRSAPSAASTSKIQPSKPAATYSAKTVSKNGEPRGQGNARTAINRLGSRIICMSPSELPTSPLYSSLISHALSLVIGVRQICTILSLLYFKLVGQRMRNASPLAVI